MFGRDKKTSVEPTDGETTDELTTKQDDPQQKKGRPTPSRREAEKARKEARFIPADPKAAKKARKERMKLERERARAGMMSGDERYLPARDQGPGKAFTRDYVDSHRRLSEYFVFLALAMLLGGLINNPAVQNLMVLVWMTTFFVVVGEMLYMLFRLSRELKKRFPDPADRKGCKFYAVIRALQIRKLRIPPPRVKPGGAPRE